MRSNVILQKLKEKYGNDCVYFSRRKDLEYYIQPRQSMLCRQSFETPYGPLNVTGYHGSMVSLTKQGYLFYIDYVSVEYTITGTKLQNINFRNLKEGIFPEDPNRQQWLYDHKSPEHPIVMCTILPSEQLFNPLGMK